MGGFQEIDLVTGLGWGFTAVAVIVTGWRYLLRLRRIGGLLLDDFLQGAALVGLFVYMGIDTAQARLLQSSGANAAFYERLAVSAPIVGFVCVPYLVKFTFLAMYRKMFVRSPPFTWWLAGVNVFVAISFVASFLSYFWTRGSPYQTVNPREYRAPVAEKPLADHWKELSASPSVADVQIVQILTLVCALNTATTLAVMLLPVAMLHWFDLRSSTKYGLFSVFLLVVIDVACDIVRTAFTIAAMPSVSEPVAAVEAPVAVIISAIAALGPAFQTNIDRIELTPSTQWSRDPSKSRVPPPISALNPRHVSEMELEEGRRPATQQQPQRQQQTQQPQQHQHHHHHQRQHQQQQRADHFSRVRSLPRIKTPQTHLPPRTNSLPRLASSPMHAFPPRKQSLPHMQSPRSPHQRPHIVAHDRPAVDSVYVQRGDARYGFGPTGHSPASPRYELAAHSPSQRQDHGSTSRSPARPSPGQFPSNPSYIPTPKSPFSPISGLSPGDGLSPGAGFSPGDGLSPGEGVSPGKGVSASHNHNHNQDHDHDHDPDHDALSPDSYNFPIPPPLPTSPGYSYSPGGSHPSSRYGYIPVAHFPHSPLSPMSPFDFRPADFRIDKTLPPTPTTRLSRADPKSFIPLVHRDDESRTSSRTGW